MKKIYKARKGARFTNKQAQIYGKHIEKISSNGQITPQKLLEEAHLRTSPLHNYFDWNDKKAAKKYRLEQARHLLSHLVIEIVIEKGKSITQKGYFSVTTCKGEPVYVNCETALTDKYLRKQIISDAYQKLQYWMNAYKEYREFKNIFSAIKKLGKKLKT